MRCPRCNALIENDAVFCGNCGASVASQPDQDLKTVSDRTFVQLDDKTSFTDSRYGPSRFQGPPLQTDLPVSSPPRQQNTPPIVSPPATHLRRNILIGVLLLLLIAGGTVGLLLAFKNNAASGVGSAPRATSTPRVVASTASGQVVFVDDQNGSPGYTDALKIAVTGLKAPPSGSQ